MPPTHFGNNNTPAFTEAASYIKLVQTGVETVFVDGGNRSVAVMPCDDPKISVAMRPQKSTVEKCVTWMDTQNNPQVAVKFTNGWLLTADREGTKQVSSSSQLGIQ